MLNKLINFVFVYKKKIIALFFLLVGICLSVSFYSFNSHDQSLIYHNSDGVVVKNLLGFFGANFSALFFYLFGFAACLFIPFLFYVAYILARDISLKFEVERVFSLFTIPFIVSALCSMHTSVFFDTTFSGGVLGNGLKIIFVGWFDYIGARLFLYSLLSIAIVLSFRSTVTYLLHGTYAFAGFVSSKQKFLIPAYNVTRKVVHVLSVPYIFSFRFCKKLFCGDDVVGKNESIVTFENYIFDQNEPEEFQELYSMIDKSENVQGAKKQRLEKNIEQQGIWEDNQELKTYHQEKFDAEKNYTLPDCDLFDYYDLEKNDDVHMSELKERAKVLDEKLEMFGVFGEVVSIKRGPVITLFEYKPKADSKISKIVALGDDLALALQALSIRIIAPIPGRSVVGFEVANKKRQDVLFSSIIKSQEVQNFPGSIPLILGKDTVGNDVVVDLAKMPHLLIAGSTGSGKSVALNSLLISMLYKLTPDELNLILIDPKRLEFSAYDEIAHLLFPIITDTKKVSPALKWVVNHMEERYEKMAQVGARSIFDYNKKVDEKMPFIVIVIDELADLMMTAGRDVESLIARIAQMARAAGIHMIVATQRPSVDVITGLIKVNFPSRISFRVTSKVDSRTILDCCGAEKLLGRGDMLFLGSGSSSLRRLHGSYVSSLEIERVVNHIKLEREVTYRDLSEYIILEETKLSSADDELYKGVLEFLDSVDEVSISLLQRKFRIGYNRSARIIEKLESEGLILPSDGGKTRKVVR